jgi:hypothetical protein
VRGSPLLRALFAFCLIALLGWPLWHLTRPVEVAASLPVAFSTSEAKAIGLQLTFTVVPKSFAVRHLEKDVWMENTPQASNEREVSLVFPEKGVDLVFHIEWPVDAPLAAARVRLTDPAGDIHEKSVWGRGSVDEVLTFP